MNCTIYLFGKFGQGITASVNDYTKNFFEEFISKANAPTQIIVHRSGDIINYGYVRKIENNHLFGVCMQINGQYISATDKLFDTFENIVANCAVKGDILFLNKQGNIEATTSNLLDKPEEVERVIANCHSEILKLSSDCSDLPAIDYSTTDFDNNYFKENDNVDAIISASVKNGYTFIYKERDYDTLALGGYRSTLSSLNKENEAYKKQVAEQDKKLKNLERAKKQMGAVVSLLIIMFIGSIVFFNTIEEKNANLMDREQTIEEQKAENSSLARENKEIQKEKTDLQSRNRDLAIQQESINQEYTNLKVSYEALRNDVAKLKKENTTLSQTNKSCTSEISSLKSKITSLEWKLKNAENTIVTKNTDYQTLVKKYNEVCSKLSTIEKKYYATKEGKKERYR